MTHYSITQIITWWQAGLISDTEARRMSGYAKFIVELTTQFGGYYAPQV